MNDGLGSKAGTHGLEQSRKDIARTACLAPPNNQQSTRPRGNSTLPKSGLAAVWFPKSFSRKRQSLPENSRAPCIMWNLGKPQVFPAGSTPQLQPETQYPIRTQPAFVLQAPP